MLIKNTKKTICFSKGCAPVSHMNAHRLRNMVERREQKRSLDQLCSATGSSCEAIVEIEANNKRLKHGNALDTSIVLLVACSVGSVTALAEQNRSTLLSWH